jgi:ligand-binding sensor domain-containing protein
MFRYLVFLTLLSFTLDAHAFSFVLQNFDVDHGLPSSETHKIFQDSKGYIWIATDAGVSRYDGYTFTNYTTREGLSDNTVFGFYEDRKGRIWFRTFSGDPSYYYKGTIYRPFESTGTKNIFNGDITVSLYVDEQDTLWAAGQRSLYKVHISGKKVQKILVNSHYYIQTFPDGEYIFGRQHEGEITKFELKYFSGNIDIPAHPTMHRSLANVWLSVVKNGNDDYFFSDGSAIYRIYHKHIEQLHLPVGKFGYIFIYPEKNFLWVGKVNGGVIRVDLNTMDTIHLLHHMTVSSMLVDKAGGYWFSTTEKGIYYLDNFYIQSLYPNGNGTSSVHSLASGPAGLFIGTSEGLYNYSLTTDQLSFIAPGYIRSICYANNLVYYNAATQVHVIDPLTYLKREVYKINNVINFSASGKNIFYHNHKAIGMLSSETPVSVMLPTRPHCIYNITEDSLLTGTQYGVYAIGSNFLPQRIFENEAMLNCRIEDLQIARDGTMYFATRGNGLIIRKNKKFYRVGKEHGLKSDICYKILIASNDHVYVGTNNGISVFKPGELSASFFISKAHGLISSDIQCLSEWDQKIFAGTSKGVSVFPVSFIPVLTPPPFFIESIRTTDSVFHLADPTTLAPSESFFSVHFVALRYNDAGERLYRYRIREIDSAWKETNNTFVNYSKLPKGKYTFEVQSINAIGQPWSDVKKVSLTLLPYFYQTGWFLVLCIVMVTFVIAYLIYFFLKRKLEKSRNLTKFAELELKALRSQINPHFIFNCLTSVQNLILKKEVDGAELYLSKFSSFLRNNLISSRENFILVGDEFKYLKQYVELESMRLKDKFFYVFDIDPTLESSKLYIPPMLIQPYIENAIWHGLHHKQGEKKLSIRAFMNNGQVKIIIHDNGIGRAASVSFNNETKPFKSLGMTITNERLEMLRLQTGLLFSVIIIDEYNIDTPSGTKVELTLPYIENEFINRYYRRRRAVYRNADAAPE